MGYGIGTCSSSQPTFVLFRWSVGSTEMVTVRAHCGGFNLGLPTGSEFATLRYDLFSWRPSKGCQENRSYLRVANSEPVGKPRSYPGVGVGHRKAYPGAVTSTSECERVSTSPTYPPTSPVLNPTSPGYLPIHSHQHSSCRGMVLSRH